MSPPHRRDAFFSDVAEALRRSSAAACQHLLPAGRVRGREFEVGDISGNPGDSLRINLRTGRWADFASAEHRGGDLIALWAAIRGLTQREARDDAAAWLGMEVPADRRRTRPNPDHRRTLTAMAEAATSDADAALEEAPAIDAEIQRRHRQAKRIWETDTRAVREGDQTWLYLRRRGYTGPIPDSIHHAERLPYWIGDDEAGRAVNLGTWPALVAAVECEGHGYAAVQRIYLSPGGEKAVIAHGRASQPTKKAAGNPRGGLVHLSAPGPVLAIGEGIETMLAVLETRPDLFVGAALAASFLPLVVAPAGVREVILCADADEAGEKAALKAARHFHDAGLTVRIARPPARRKGYDFADLLAEDGPAAVRNAIDHAVVWLPFDAKRIRAEQQKKLIQGVPPLPHAPVLGVEMASARLASTMEGVFGRVRDWQAARIEAKAKRDEARQAVLTDCGIASVDDIEGDAAKKKLRAIMKARAGAASVQVRQEHGFERWRKPPVFVIKATAGIGKTRFVVDQLAQAHWLYEKNIDVFTPRVDLADEIAEATDRAIHTARRHVIRSKPQTMRGRSQISPATGDPMCARHKLAERVAALGHPVFSTLCRRKNYRTGNEDPCPHYDACPYIEQYKPAFDGTHLPTTRVFSHDHLCLPRTLGVPMGDLIVIDENPIEALLGETGFGVDRLLQTHRFYLTPDEEAWLRGLSSQVVDALRTGEALRALRDAGIMASDIARAAELEDKSEAADALGVSPGMNDDVIRKRLNEFETSERHKRARMFRQLARELDLPRDQCIGVELRQDAEVEVDGRMERQERILVHYHRKVRRRATAPVIILDDSANIEVYRALFGEQVELIEIQAERQAEVVQVYSSTFSGRQLLADCDDRPDRGDGNLHQRKESERKREGVAALVERMADDHGPGLVVSTKKVRRALTGEAAGKLPVDTDWGGGRIAHFGALRGRDGFKGVPWTVIVGREQPPPLAIEGKARAIFCNDPAPLMLMGDVDDKPTYPWQPRGYLMRDGSHVGVPAQVHPDRRVNAVLEMSRECETQQAIDRARLVHRDAPCRVMLLSSLPIPGLVVDRLVTWPEARDGGTRYERAWRRLGVLPTAPAALAAAFSDLFPTSVAAKEYGRRKTGVGSQINIYLGSDTSFREARYRCANARGPMARALYDPARYPDPADARAALQHALGVEVTAFEVEPLAVAAVVPAQAAE